MRNERAGKLLLGLTLLLAGGIAAAEQFIEIGDYVVHYAALPTSDLAPATARSYGVRRSSKRGLLVLNAQHRDQPLKSVPAIVEGTVKNLIGQTKTNEFREIREGGTIYNIAEFSFSNLETLVFRLQIRPGEASRSGALSFQQQFYVTPN